MTKKKQPSTARRRPLDAAEQAQRMVDQIAWAEQVVKRIARNSAGSPGDERPAVGE